MSISTLGRPSLISALSAITLAVTFGPISYAEASEVKNKAIKSTAIKKAGRTTTSAVINTLLNGIGAPSSSLGMNGDFYIDTVAMNIYGPKSKNAWPLPKSLIGPSGAPGVIGKSGSNGKDGRDGSNGKDGDRGPTGASSSGAGDVGPQGPTGLAGPAGPIGPAGPAGAQGVAGAPGAAGPAGAPGSTGAAGAAGLNGSVGATGARGETGAQGAQGTQGATGTAGMVRLIHGNTLSLTLSTSSAGSGITSESVINYQPNKKYSFMLRQFGAITSTQKTKTFGMDVFATNALNLKYSVIVTEAYSFRSGVAAHEYIFEAVGTFSTTSNSGDLSFSIFDGSGVTGANPMNLTGVYQLIEIGELSRIDQTNPVTAIS